jgi:hypothetical protein
MRSDGVYVDGSIQGIKVTFTADTGAARTVISSKLFRKIPNSKKPRLERSSFSQFDISGSPLPFIRISKPNRASSSISATINSLSRVKLPRVMSTRTCQKNYSC